MEKDKKDFKGNQHKNEEANIKPRPLFAFGKEEAVVLCKSCQINLLFRHR